MMICFTANDLRVWNNGDNQALSSNYSNRYSSSASVAIALIDSCP
jgi:hypothetical protein